MVAVGVMGIVIAGLTTVLDNSNREVKSLQQKFEILQTQQDLMRDLSDPGICACNFDPTKNVTNAATLSFDTTNPDSMMSSPNLFATCIGGVPGSPLITIGQPLPGSQAGLKVKTIQMKEFVATGTGRYRARIEVAFDASSLKIARKPASVNVSVVADVSNPAQAKITSCTAGKDIGASGACPAGTYSAMGGATGTHKFDCPLPNGTVTMNATAQGYAYWNYQTIHQTGPDPTPCSATCTADSLTQASWKVVPPP